MKGRSTGHRLPRSRGSGAGSFRMYSISRREEPPGPTPRRIYPEVHNVRNLGDCRRLAELIEEDKIPNNLKRQRLQFMYALTYAPSFVKQFQQGEIHSARAFFHTEYRKYAEPERVI